MPDVSGLMDVTDVGLADTDEHTKTAPANARALWLLPPVANTGTVDFRTTPGSATALMELPVGIWTKIEDRNIAGRDWSFQRVAGGAGDTLNILYLLGGGG